MYPRINPSRKAISIAFIFVLLSVTILGSGAISYEVSAATAIDPFHIRAAPHFREAIYSMSAPTYLQRFDELGAWKVSTGSPAIGGWDDSTLTITSPSTSLCDLFLAKANAPGMNTSDMTYVETRMATSSSSAYVNMTLEQVSTGYIAVISMHGGLITYSCDITPSGKATGTLYSSAATSTYYKVAFNLAPVGITFYAASGSGVALADHNIANSRMTVGDVSKMHLSVSGASAKGTWDYIFVANEAPLAMESVSDLTMEPMTPGSSTSGESVKVDPTVLKFSRSGNSDVSGMFGIPSTAGLEKNLTTFLTDLGRSNESAQRVQGRMYAEGWSDFRGDTEAALKAAIADTKSVSSDSIYLIDYYIDYIQQETTFNQQIVNNKHAQYHAALKAALNAEGYDSEKISDLASQAGYGSSSPSTQISINVPFLTSTQLSAANGGMLNNSEIDKAKCWTAEEYAICLLPFGQAAVIANRVILDGKLEAQRTWNNINPLSEDNRDKAAKAAQDLINQMAQPLIDAGANISEALKSLVSDTTEAFTSAVDGMSAMMASSLANTNELVSGLNKDWADRFNDLSNLTGDFMTWSQQQSEMTNAMFSQMFLSMQNSMAETQRMFMGQIASTNQALLNVTNGLFTGGDMSKLLAGGKTTESTPWTISGIFGNDWTSNTLIIVLLISIALIMVIALIFVLKGRNRGRRSR